MEEQSGEMLKPMWDMEGLGERSKMPLGPWGGPEPPRTLLGTPLQGARGTELASPITCRSPPKKNMALPHRPCWS